MRNEFLDELKSIAMESAGVEVTIDPYAGSMCSEERLTLDVLDAHEVAMESYTEALFSEAFGAQELALESAELSFEEIKNFNGELSMESVVNAVKRGAYGAQIQVKKIVQKIVKFVMSIFDYLTVADGKFKSYNKLLKKYKDKLNKLNPASSSGDKEEKEYTIRDWSELSTDKSNFDKSAQVENLKKLLTAASDSSNLTKINDAIFALAGASHGINGADSDPTDDELDKTLQDFKDKVKENLKELKDDFKNKDTKEGTYYELKRDVLSWLDQAIKDTAKDVKYKGEIRKIKGKMNKLSDKVLKDDTTNAKLVRKLNKVAPAILSAVQQEATLRYKHVAGGYQGLLADAAKLISAGTKVND